MACVEVAQHSMLSGFGAGQADFMWRARLLPRVRDTFATIWGTHDLLSSFDGGNAFRPWAGRPEWRTQGGWYHVDQGATRHGLVADKYVTVAGEYPEHHHHATAVD